MRMVSSETRRRQIACFAISVYALTIYAVYSSAKTSISFLQATIKLTTGFNVVILTIFTILNSAVLWKLSTSLLFGNLRLIEYEHIFERLPFTIINTVFMSSMFHDQDFFTVTLFGLLLLYMKVFHWILKDRLEALLQSIHEATTLKSLVCTRFTFNLVLLAILDYKIVSGCITNSLDNSFGASTSVHLMVGMEFAMLLIDLLNLAMHTVLNFYEFYRIQSASHLSSVGSGTGDEAEENEDEDTNESSFAGLEGKFMYERAIDVFIRFLKTLVHVMMLIPFRMSFLLIKDVFWDVLTLCQNVSNLWRIWQNNKQLDDKLKTMSPEELSATDNICIVCMDELCADLDEVVQGPNRHKIAKTGKYKPKRLPCGHVLHLFCLKNWMERSQTCPICRLPVFDENGTVVQSQGSTTNRNAQAANHTPNMVVPAGATTTTAASTTGMDRSGGPTVSALSSHQVSEQTSGSPTPTPTFVTPNSNIANLWYSYPIQEAKDGAVTFSLTDSESGNPIRAKLSLDSDDNEAQRITIPNDCIHHLESIQGLKRRISELEAQVRELSEN